MAADNTMNNTVIELKDVATYFFIDEGVLKALNGVSFKIDARKTLGVIGESGCGKSVTAQSILRIVPPPGKTVGGTITFWHKDGRAVNLLDLHPDGEEIRAIRGREISMIFQEPMTSLSPVHTIGDQISEVILLHRTRNKREAKEITLDMLNKVGISNAPQRYNEYPHQFSGGMRQRAMIAMALSCNPTLLIADEPTTALDVTVQAQILDLMHSMQAEMGMAMMYITHDLGVIADIADEVAVMYLGMVVEYADVRSTFREPLHPYTQLLLKSIPRIGRKARTRLDAIEGNVPIPLNLRAQCPFLDRCPQVIPGVCESAVPEFYQPRPGHLVRCFHYRDSGVGDEQ
ncbi:MAG: Oligopeptide transport ATP-binding protein OppD [Chloroflexi bacterium ADurb.Bin325]|nr:MAG: Oligopeptide transport ATP-binding protein OppD [Chloroflexi bacterium ADurb.Bin325]